MSDMNKDKPNDAGRSMITDEAVEAVAKKAFQKKEGIRWDATSEGSRRKWRKQYRAQMEAMARAEAKNAAGAREHVTDESGDCWCNPKVVRVAP